MRVCGLGALQLCTGAAGDAHPKVAQIKLLVICFCGIGHVIDGHALPCGLDNHIITVRVARLGILLADGNAACRGCCHFMSKGICLCICRQLHLRLSVCLSLYCYLFGSRTAALYFHGFCVIYLDGSILIGCHFCLLHQFIVHHGIRDVDHGDVISTLVGIGVCYITDL